MAMALLHGTLDQRTLFWPWSILDLKPKQSHLQYHGSRIYVPICLGASLRRHSSEVGNIWQSWRDALSQLLLYNIASPRCELRVYVFGDRPGSYTDDDERAIVSVFSKHGITIFHIAMLSDTKIRVRNLKTSEISEHIVAPVCNTEPPQLSADEKTEIEKTLKSAEFIDLEKVVKWLDTLKSNLVKTLRKSYKADVDYTIKKEPNPVKRRYGSNNWSTVRVSPSCFKELAMRSNSKNSAFVRSYLLQVQDVFIG